MNAGAPQSLILVPTQLELQRLENLGGFDSDLGRVACCGFGPVGAAARTAGLLALHRPRRVVLVGIAGTYDPQHLAIGEATCFRTVAIDGVGAGSGREFLSAEALGFAQAIGDDGGSFGDRLPLATLLSAPTAELLVTACAAAGDADEARLRAERLDGAAAEDLEGYGSALACSLAQVPIAIVRGISNRVGDRDSRHWQIDAALASARPLALRLLNSPESWELRT